MTDKNPASILESFLVQQVKQLGRMEKLEFRRLAMLTSEKPETALTLQKESDEIFQKSVALQKKIDELMEKVDMATLTSEMNRKISSLAQLVRKLAKRNYDLNQQCKEALGKILNGISDQIAGFKKGRQAVRSYNPHSGGGSTISGQL